MSAFATDDADATLASPASDHPNPGSTSDTTLISDRERYSRQVLFPGIGESGQQLLGRSHVVLVGVGATGAAAASLLARAGVGHLTLIDRDFVESSNLQRQMLFDEADARDALPKAEAARRHLKRINSGVRVTARIADLVPLNAADLLAADIVLDCTDNFETRYLINDLCVRDGRPWIYAAAVGAYAATMNILPKQGLGIREQGLEKQGLGNREQRTEDRTPSERGAPFMTRPHRDMGGVDEFRAPNPYSLLPNPSACLACIFPTPPSGNIETCDTAGILSTAVNLAASLQVTEALKFLTRQPHLMRRTLVSFDLWTPAGRDTIARSEISTTKPRPDCEVCGQRIFRALSGDQRPHITLCGRNSVQIHEHHRPIDLAALQQRLASLGKVRSNGLLLRFERPPYTLTVFPDGRALVQGTTDTGLARSLYARFVGS